MENFYKRTFDYKSELISIAPDIHNMMGYGTQAYTCLLKVVYPDGKEIVETACLDNSRKPCWIPSKSHRHSDDLVNIIHKIWGDKEIGWHYHNIVCGTIQEKSLEF